MRTSTASSVRKATLADVAAVARLLVPAIREARCEAPALYEPDELCAPELALRLLEDLDDGNVIYVADREGRIEGLAQVTGLMVGDGGHLVELRRLYVSPEHRHRGLGRQLLFLTVRDLRQRSNAPSLRAWAPAGSTGAGFFTAVGGSAVRSRWKVGPGGVAVRGTLFSWTTRAARVARSAPAVRRNHALA